MSQLKDLLAQTLAEDLKFAPPSNLPAREVACAQIASSLFKKWQDDGATEQADAAALKKFMQVNSSLPDGPYSPYALNEEESNFWSFFRENFRDAVSPRWVEDRQTGELYDCHFGYGFIADRMWTGPGSALKADSSTVVTKLWESPLSYTQSELITVYRAALANSGLWADAEMLRSKNFGFTLVKGERMFFAFKNAEISRTCGTQPSLNLLIQMAVGAWYTDRLYDRFGIDLSEQPARNKRLARIGSTYGNVGTIDLVSASDHISRYLVDWLMDESLLKSAMFWSRSELADLPTAERVPLRMMSTMGNGFTFPLQTLIFACIVKSVYQLLNIPFRSSKTDYGVFGDDIIVQAEAYDKVVHYLHRAGFVVNVDKSFNVGGFRESCGGDYYHGFNVRGVYLRSLKTPQLVASAINRLNRWSGRTGVKLSRTVVLLSTLLGKKTPKVPPSENDDAGIHAPYCTVPLKVVYSDDLGYGFSYKRWAAVPFKVRVNEPDSTENPYGVGGLIVGRHISRREHLVTEVFDQEDPDKNLGILCSVPIEVGFRKPLDAEVYYKIRSTVVHFWDTRLIGDAWEGVSHEHWKTFMTMVG